MVSIIEQAAQRLEQLRNAGIEVPETTLVRGDTAAARGAPPRPGGDVFRTPTRQDNGHAVVADLARRVSKHVDIDLNRLRLAGFVTPDAPRSRIADEFRVIKRPLISNSQGRSAAPIARANLIMVTSSVPREGKSFVALNLAMSISMEVDNTVLLVDGDVIAPSLLKMMGIPPSKGLIDLLIDPSLDPSDTLLRTNIERLAILPAGTRHERASELLASEAMGRLIEDLASRYPDRIIVFDSPPLLATTESRVLAAHMGQIVLVVRADNTSRGAVEESVKMLEQCPVVATVLNGASESEVGTYYDSSEYR
jgi:protein-tyrosine kinase